jgi:hypothetical protein
VEFLKQPVPHHQLLPDFRLHFRLQPGEELFASVAIHCRKIGEKFIASPFLFVTTPPDTGGEKRADRPNRDCRPRDDES